jgi:hypothetical protein
MSGTIDSSSEEWVRCATTSTAMLLTLTSLPDMEQCGESEVNQRHLWFVVEQSVFQFRACQSPQIAGGKPDYSSCAYL